MARLVVGEKHTTYVDRICRLLPSKRTGQEPGVTCSTGNFNNMIFVVALHGLFGDINKIRTIHYGSVDSEELPPGPCRVRCLMVFCVEHEVGNFTFVI